MNADIYLPFLVLLLPSRYPGQCVYNECVSLILLPVVLYLTRLRLCHSRGRNFLRLCCWTVVVQEEDL